MGEDSIGDRSLTKEYRFDYFLCHDYSDRPTAVKIFNFLERQCGFKVCFDPRDGEGGKTECENLDFGINNSKFILLLLSSESLKCNWFSFKVKAAISRCIETPGRSAAVIPVFVGISPKEAPPVLRSCSPAVYDANSDSGFWTKLRRLGESSQ